MAELVSLFIIRYNRFFCIGRSYDGGLTQTQFEQIGDNPIADYVTH